ncbi:MAG TPA: alpha/beta hydrolase [Bacillota bacterium]|nr:alpha/beta hydrolase [Bacillota bacterium]
MNKCTDVTIEGAYPLSGTLTWPTEKRNQYPAVLIIPGTGKLDRDGNDKKLQLNLYKDLAEFLTVLGFMTLRYDKRGIQKSGGNYYETGVHDLIDDACASVQFLQAYDQVDQQKIVILGHSEGAMIAPAVHHHTPVSGLILLAGAAEPSKDLLLKQLEMVIEEIENTKGLKGWLYRVLKLSQKIKKQNKSLMKKINDSDEAVMRIRGAKINAKWIRDQRHYNVCDYLPEVACPVLAITGDKDLQVPPDHAERIAEIVKGDSEWHLLPHVNHILRHVTTHHTMLGLTKEYKKIIDHPIDDELLSIIERWLTNRYLHTANEK